jgi:FAD/FMN-containing dehydrogenase
MPAPAIPPAALAALRSSLGPAGIVEAAPDIAPYLADFRKQYGGASPLVMLPAGTDEVSRILAICHAHGVGVVPHGGNTSYCGGATPDESGSQVVLALKRMNRIRAIEPDDFAISVEAGCVLADVQAAAERADRHFPLSLGSEGTCQIGGNLSTNAGGTAVLRFGMMRDLVLGVEVVLADGRVLDALNSLRKDNTGYDLKQLFIGAEGTLGIITAATLKLFPRPTEFATAFVALPDPAAAVALLGTLRAASGDAVTTFELIPRIAVELTARHIPGVRDPLATPHTWYALVELSSARTGDNLQQLLESALANAAEKALVADAAVVTSLAQREAVWRLRESIPEAQRHEGASIKHDVSLPISRLAAFLAEATRLVERQVPEGVVIPYGHLGDGNLHFNIQHRGGSDPRAFLGRAAAIRRSIHDLVAANRGSFSAEHGIGRSKVEELERYESAVGLDLMRSLKRTLDPKGILNPGKVLAARNSTE